MKDIDFTYNLYKKINISLNIIGVILALVSYFFIAGMLSIFGIIVFYLIYNRQSIRIKNRSNIRIIKLSYLSSLGLIYIFVFSIINFLYLNIPQTNIKILILMLPGLILVVIPQILCRVKKN